MGIYCHNVVTFFISLVNAFLHLSFTSHLNEDKKDFFLSRGQNTFTEMTNISSRNSIGFPEKNVLKPVCGAIFKSWHITCLVYITLCHRG